MEPYTVEADAGVLTDKPAQMLEPKPWSFWQTIGLSAAIGAASFIFQILFAVVWVVIKIVMHGHSAVENLQQDSAFLLSSTLVAYPLVLGLLVLFVRMRHCGSIAGYLALERVPLRSVLPWLGWLCGFMVLSMFVSHWLDRPVPKIMVQFARSSNAGLLFIALGVITPFVEEVFFRGFMFKGLAASRVGAVGAVVLTSLLWTAMHCFEYGWFECACLAVLGLILGAARLKTGSVLVPVVIHSINNSAAIVSLLVLQHTGQL